MKDKVTLITGMDRFYQHGSDVHAQCASCFLSSATAHSVEASVYPLARTLDHIVADHVGDATPFRTLEFSCNSHRDNKESIYFDNVSWYGTGHVAPSIRDPRKAYRRMFGTRETQARYRSASSGPAAPRCHPPSNLRWGGAPPASPKLRAHRRS